MPRRPQITPPAKRISRPRLTRTGPSVPVSAIRYRGPLKIPNTDTMTVTLLDGATVASSAAGVITATFNNNPSSARNFSEFSTSWFEYRVLGVRFAYYPISPTPNLTLQTCSGSQSVVHGTVPGAPSSLSQAFSTGIAKPFSGFLPFQREWRMQTVNESVFVPTASPASSSDTLVLYADNATVSQVFGNLMIEYLIQFKTHRL